MHVYGPISVDVTNYHGYLKYIYTESRTRDGIHLSGLSGSSDPSKLYTLSHVLLGLNACAIIGNTPSSSIPDNAL
jgi:hypothetical protein